MKQRVVFRADGNLSIGYGHFVRSLGIADLIKTDFHCVFAIQSPTDYQVNEINKVCEEIIKLKNNDSQFEEFLQYIKSDDIVVLDNYFFTSAYQLRIKAIGCKLIFVDDHNDKNYVCDALINNIPGFPESSFKKMPYTKLYLGIDYALLRKEFFDKRLREVQKKQNNFFLAFGGADVYNLSTKIVNFLSQINPSCNIDLLIGDAFRFYESVSEFSNINIYKNIDAAQVAQLMAKAEVCVVPASSLLNETASVGSRILVGYFVDNQTQPYNYFVENKLAIGAGDYRELSFQHFKTVFEQVRSADYLIPNQREKYFFQQPEKLKQVFYDLQQRD